MATEGIIEPQNHWLLAGVEPEDVEPLIEAGRQMRFLPGEAIFREGDAADGLYLIVGGSTRVSATGDNGETYLATVKANEVLGEMGVLDGEPRSGTATALTVCAAYFLPTEPFLDLLELSPIVSMRLLALLAARLRATNYRLVELPAMGTITREDTAIAP